MTFRSGVATVAAGPDPIGVAPCRNSGVTFPIHNDKEHDGGRAAVPPMPAGAGRSACLLYPLSENRAPATGGRGLVEVNGIEPMTSCLQSRRSPD